MVDTASTAETHTEIWIQQQPKEVISEAVADETIIINLLNGHYHRLDGLASRLWAVAATETPFHLWGIGIGAGEDGAALPDGALAAFALALTDAGLMIVSDGAEAKLERLAAAGPANGERPVLTLESYSDMEDLLLLDPIHDVDEHGWPSAAEPTR